MRISLLMLAPLLLAAPAHAQSRDSDDAVQKAPDNDKVFDSLFGTEPARISGNRSPRAGRDDLSIVALYLGRFQLLESLPAHANPAGLCLPLVPVLDALEIGHGEADGRTVIEFRTPNAGCQSIPPR